MPMNRLIHVDLQYYNRSLKFIVVSICKISHFGLIFFPRVEGILFAFFVWMDLYVATGSVGGSRRQLPDMLPVPEGLYLESISQSRSQLEVHTDRRTELCGARFSPMVMVTSVTSPIQALVEVDVINFSERATELWSPPHISRGHPLEFN